MRILTTSHVLAAIALMSATGCGTTFVNRGLHEQTRWLETQVTQEATSASELEDNEVYNFDARFEAQVSPSTSRGAEHNPAERSALPDLHLYVRINGQRTEVGQAPNAQTLIANYPLRLKRGDTVEVRLVDRRNIYFAVQYDSREADDWSVNNVRETPLSQYQFTFEGPGRYFFHRGYALMFVDFRKME